MRRISTLLRSLLLVGSAVVLVGCGDEVLGQKSCTTDDDCLKIAGDVYDQDSGVGTPPQCCNKVCVVESPGCDPDQYGRSYRFLTTLPTYGACVAEPMCPGPSNDEDMTVTPTVDMSSAD